MMRPYGFYPPYKFTQRTIALCINITLISYPVERTDREAYR
jgi:hypothetical protein